MTKSLRHPASDAVDRLLNPNSIAVVGSLREARFGGYVTTNNLLRFGFKGKIFPVNPQYDTVLNMKVYPSVKDIPEPVDLVVTMAGAPAVPSIISDSIQNKAKVAIIISDGFGERSDDGKRLQQEVNRIAEAGELRLLGPNTIGVANPAIGLITTPYRVTYDKMFTGGVALCAQTGLIGPQNMPLEETHYGLSKMCDFGNKCDIDEIDLLDYLARRSRDEGDRHAPRSNTGRSAIPEEGEGGRGQEAGDRAQTRQDQGESESHGLTHRFVGRRRYHL